MSKLLNTYKNLKEKDFETIYLFKNGAFYLALEDDAKLLSNEFELKLTNLNANAVKCGFPCSSFDKYYLKLKNIDKEFKIVDSLITNFHLPESTLIMLVSAFYNRDAVMAAYEEAVEERYRFFSFGDSMFLI